jgi:hypothetical protein
MKISVIALNLIGVFVLTASIAAWADCGPAKPSYCTTVATCDDSVSGICQEKITTQLHYGCYGDDQYLCYADGDVQLDCFISGNVCNLISLECETWDGGSSATVPVYDDSDDSCGG